MAYISLELLRKKNKGLFRLVLATAERANEINTGAKLLVVTNSKNPASKSLEEFAAGKVYYEDVEVPQEQPKPVEEE